MNLSPFALALSLFASTQPNVEGLLERAENLSSPQVRRADLALPIFRQVLALAKDPALEYRARFGLGRALLSLHKKNEAREALHQALALARQTGSIADQGACLLTLGGLAYEQGDFDAQFRWIQELLRLGERTGHLPTRLRGRNFLVATLRRHGRAAEAVRQGRDALKELDEAAEQKKDFPRVLLFQIPYNLGKALADAGDPAEGIGLLERAREAAESQNNLAGAWHVFHDIGEIYAMTGETEAATRYYLRALEVARRIDSRDPEAITLRGLGAVAESHGDLEAATRYYHEALAIFEQVGHHSEVPESLVLLSQAQWRAGYKTLARASLQRAIATAEQTRHSMSLAKAYLARGQQNEQAGPLDLADADYRQALKITTQNGMQSLVPAAWNGIASTARQRGDLRQALEAYSAAADAVDGIRARLPSEQQRISFVATTHAIYDGWIEALLHSGGADREAFLALERERSRNLLDALRETGSPPRASQDAKLEARIAQLQLQLGTSELGPELRKTLMRELEDAERQFDLLTPRAVSPLPERSMATLQGAVHEDEAFLAYTSRPDGVLIFVVTSRGLRVFRSSIGDLEARVAMFNRALADSDEQEALRIGVELARSLVQPIELSEPIRRVIVSASGELAGLPFGALPLPNGQPLVESFEVVYAPSLSAISTLRGVPRSHRRYDMLAVAPLGALPATLREINKISSYLPRQVDTLVDTTATESFVKRQPLADYNVLHFATHAVLDSRFPSRSAIELASAGMDDDGKLRIREIYRLRLADQLVVLSACATAYGRPSAAEGMQSLAQAFLYAGARSVVGTLWRVEDEAAGRFIDRFYRRLSAGATVSSAVRAAQIDTAGARPYATAAAWAPWVATGDAANHAVTDGSNFKHGVVGSMVALLGLLFVLGYLLARR